MLKEDGDGFLRWSDGEAILAELRPNEKKTLVALPPSTRKEMDFEPRPSRSKYWSYNERDEERQPEATMQ